MGAMGGRPTREGIYVYNIADSRCCTTETSLVAQLVENPPAVQETLVRFLGQEDPPEKG